MNNLIKNNYNWKDIIEPTNITETIPVWEYIVIFLIALLISFVLVKYFNIILRFKLWILTFKIKKTMDSRKIAKKILSLFRLEKDTIYIEKKLHLNKKIGVDYRLELLKACYANTIASPKHIITLIKMPTKWL